jgi:NAD(P) transhydrogenase subunit alpha
VSTDILTLITVFVLSAFVGFEVISKVPSILHTPLMSGTNAIHGVIIVGAILVLGTGHGTAELALGFVAVVLATLNVVGGFVVTDRMLEMFKGRPPAKAAAPASPAVAAAPSAGEGAKQVESGAAEAAK